MASHIIDLSDDARIILLSVADRLGLPPDLTNEDEQISMAIEALANSVDTAMEVAVMDDGKPLQMQEALNAILNPHIGTEFVQPSTAAFIEKEALSWDDIVKLLPTIEADEPCDEVTRQALCIVFNQISQDEWSSEHAEKMVDQTIAILRRREELASKNND